MKSYTDLEESKKLAEILPIESADMRYGYIAPYEYSDSMFDGGYDDVPYPKDFLKKNPNFSENEYDGSLPCWSLAALFEVMPKCVEGAEPSLIKTFRNDYRIVYDIHGDEGITSEDYTNPINACYEMILKLHELKML